MIETALVIGLILLIIVAVVSLMAYILTSIRFQQRPSVFLSFIVLVALTTAAMVCFIGPSDIEKLIIYAALCIYFIIYLLVWYVRKIFGQYQRQKEYEQYGGTPQ